MSQEQETATESIITSALDIFVFLKYDDYLIACRPMVEIAIDIVSRNVTRWKVIAEAPLHPDESSYFICKANGQA